MKQANAVKSFAALGNDLRLRIFRTLVKAGPAGLPASSIGERVGLSPSNLTFHLAHLERNSLVASERDGRYIRYTANFSAMGELVDFLTRDCCGGHPEVCRPLQKRKAKAS